MNMVSARLLEVIVAVLGWERVQAYDGNQGDLHRGRR